MKQGNKKFRISDDNAKILGININRTKRYRNKLSKFNQ